MKSHRNPHQSADEAAHDAQQRASCYEGVVDRIVDAENFVVDVRFGNGEVARCEVLQRSTGDSWLPSVEAPVIVLDRTAERPAVIATFSDGEGGGKVGQRTIGHKETGTRFQIDPDGNVTIQTQSDGSTTAEISVDAETGDVQIDASGSVQIGDSGGTYKPVARKGDPIDTNNNVISGGSSNVDAS